MSSVQCRTVSYYFPVISFFSFTFLVHSDLSDVNFDKYYLQVAVNIYFHRQLFTVTKEITFHNVTYSYVLFLIQLLQLTPHYILVIASLS